MLLLVLLPLAPTLNLPCHLDSQVAERFVADDHFLGVQSFHWQMRTNMQSLQRVHRREALSKLLRHDDSVLFYEVLLYQVVRRSKVLDDGALNEMVEMVCLSELLFDGFGVFDSIGSNDGLLFGPKARLLQTNDGHRHR